MTTEIVKKKKPHMRLDRSSIDDIKVATTARIINVTFECVMVAVSNDHGEEHVRSKGDRATWKNYASARQAILRHNRNIKIISTSPLRPRSELMPPLKGGPMRPLATQ